ncbi:MAG: Ltp family lipoprotein, partial [Eubacteriales bacterium]|nr:Ltp family lipoprotein [Eubacteriales bacterium]
NAKEDYSDTVAEGGYISQDPKAGETIRENQTVTVVYSKGHKPTTEEKNALAKAKDYSEMMHMSKQGIYDQLTSAYGEKFTAEEAQYAVDHLDD